MCAPNLVKESPFKNFLQRVAMHWETRVQLFMPGKQRLPRAFKVPVSPDGFSGFPAHLGAGTADPDQSTKEKAALVPTAGASVGRWGVVTCGPSTTGERNGAEGQPGLHDSTSK